MQTDKKPNRLASETSPYLLQHAYNPVDWYPWGEEAFEKAKAENKPILLSVGYSACHWCHVMERESFENPQIAEMMNRGFINIKVDREERPDVDSIYMSAVQLLTGQGGWPMTLFLTPEGKPFFGGTYYPPTDHYGRPGFPRVLEAVREAWQNQRIEIEAQSSEVTDHLRHSDDMLSGLPETLLTAQVLENAYAKLSEQFDARNGGFGNAPKFPQPMNLDFLLRFHHRSKRQEPLIMLERTLQRMAVGGIYDQLGGGFHRYSTDAVWLVPHFEKMLYDNAQLAQVYCRTYQVTSHAFYRGIAEETLDYCLREMTDASGGFYSAQDADSEGEEGKFFVWSYTEIEELLGKDEAKVFGDFFGVSPQGNWEGTNILHVVKDARQVAADFGLPLELTANILDIGRQKLFEARGQRVKPGLDDKILTGWNGLLCAAFAECGAVLERADFLEAANNNADFILTNHTYRDAEGLLRLRRTSRNGVVQHHGCLEDYAFYADALLHLFEATGDFARLKSAQELVQTILALFLDEEGAGFFATPSDGEALIHRPRDWDDNAVPSGNSVTIETLLRLATLTGNEEYRRHAANILRKMAPLFEKHPYGFCRVLGALDYYLSSPKEIVLIAKDIADLTEMQRAIRAVYLPNRVIVLQTDASPQDSLQLTEGRTVQEGKPTAYVCENFVCKAPTTNTNELHSLLTT